MKKLLILLLILPIVYSQTYVTPKGFFNEGVSGGNGNYAWQVSGDGRTMAVQCHGGRRVEPDYRADTACEEPNHTNAGIIFTRHSNSSATFSCGSYKGSNNDSKWAFLCY